MGRRLDPSDLAALLAAANWKSTEEYPGASKPWKGECQHPGCGRRGTIRVSHLKQGRPACRHGKGRMRPTSSDATTIIGKMKRTPREQYPGSIKAPWESECDVCHDVASPTLERMMQALKRGHPSALPYCLVCLGLKLTHEKAEKVMRGADLEPVDEYPGKNTKPWRCSCSSCGETDEYTYASALRGGARCRHCKPRKLVGKDSAEHDLWARGFIKIDEYPGRNHARWRVRHVACGKAVYVRLKDVRKGRGCGECNSRKKISEDQARSDFQAAGLEPYGDYPGRETDWPSVCRGCGHERLVPLKDVRTYLRKGYPSSRAFCGNCYGNLADADCVDRLSRELGYEPMGKYINARDQRWYLHTPCGNSVFKRWNDLQQGYVSCDKCSKRGCWKADDSKAGVYLLKNDQLQAVKIGVFRETSRRIKDVTKGGWQLIFLRQELDPQVAYEVEQEIVRMWRDAGIPIGALQEEMPRGGYTETAPLSFVNCKRLMRDIKLLIASRIDFEAA